MPSCLSSQTVKGKVIGIKDGDTIEMLINGKPVVVRLEGIDCPEKGQAFGTKAKTFTSDLVYGKEARIIISSYDRYRRAIAFVYFGNRVLNEELLKAGLAWHFKKYNSDKRLAKMENEARGKKIGLWSDRHSIPPWEYRKIRRAK